MMSTVSDVLADMLDIASTVSEMAEVAPWAAPLARALAERVTTLMPKILELREKIRTLVDTLKQFEQLTNDPDTAAAIGPQACTDNLDLIHQVLSHCIHAAEVAVAIQTKIDSKSIIRLQLRAQRYMQRIDDELGVLRADSDNISTRLLLLNRHTQYLAQDASLPTTWTPNFDDMPDCDPRTPAMPSLVAVYCPTAPTSAAPLWVKKLTTFTTKDLQGDYNLREFLYQWEVVGLNRLPAGGAEDTDTGKRSAFWPEGATPHTDNVYICHPHKNFYILAKRYPWYMLNDFCSELHEAMQRLGAASYTLTYKDFSTTEEEEEGEVIVGASSHGAGAQIKVGAEKALAQKLKESIHSSAEFEPIAPDYEPTYDKAGRERLYHFGQAAANRRRRLGLIQDGYKLIFDEFESRMHYRSGPTRKLMVELTFSESVAHGFAFEAALKALDYLNVGVSARAKWKSFMSGTLSVELDVKWQKVEESSPAGAGLVTRSAAAARSIAKLVVAAIGIVLSLWLATAAITFIKHLR